MMKERMMPTEEQLLKLEKYFVPETDIYFFRDRPNDIDSVITLEQFKKTVYASDIMYETFYEYWNVLKNTNYVWIDEKNKFLTFDRKKQMRILQQQIDLKRGSIVMDTKLSKEKYAIANQYVITNVTWNSLAEQQKKDVIDWMIKDFDGDMTHNIQLPVEFQNVVNCFLPKSGCNCLSFVLYCITKDKEYLNCWVSDETFLNKIKDYQAMSHLDYQAGDLILFFQNNRLVHASYCFNFTYFFNKNGQSAFNPITVKTFDELREEWQECNHIVLYRKKA